MNRFGKSSFFPDSDEENTDIPNNNSNCNNLITTKTHYMPISNISINRSKNTITPGLNFPLTEIYWDRKPIVYIY